MKKNIIIIDKWEKRIPDRSQETSVVFPPISEIVSPRRRKVIFTYLVMIYPKRSIVY